MSLALTLGAELVVAKTVDYTTATVVRHPDSPAEAFFANMAREGLRAGWDKTGEMLPWWYGALSSGASGATDFVAGTVIAGLLRSQFDHALENALEQAHAQQTVAAPTFDQVLAALKGDPIEGLSDESARALKAVVDGMIDGGNDAALLKTLLSGAPDVALKSPITRHLRMALGDPDDSAFAGFVKRNLISATHAHEDPLGGTLLGHGLAGGATGLLTGHPEIGVAVALIDALSEGLLAQKAMAGDYRALTTIKASLLMQGLREHERPADWKGNLSNRLLGMYSQMGEEVRLLGQDIGAIAAAADVALEAGQPVIAAAVGQVVVGGHALPPPSATGSAPGYATAAEVAGDATAQSLLQLAREQALAARAGLEHHANVSVTQMLAADFARERASLRALNTELHDNAAELLATLKHDYPHLGAVFDKSADKSAEKTSPPVLSRWLHAAWALLGKATSSSARAVSAGAMALGTGTATAAAAARDSALGQAILALARDLYLSVEVPVTLAVDATVDASRNATFKALDVGGNAVVAGLLAGERFVHANEVEVAAMLSACGVAVDRIAVATSLTMQELSRSATRGGDELALMLGRVLAALDRVVGRFSPPAP